CGWDRRVAPAAQSHAVHAQHVGGGDLRAPVGAGRGRHDGRLVTGAEGLLPDASIPLGHEHVGSLTNKPIEVAKSTSDQQYEWCIGAAARLRRATGPLQRVEGTPAVMT